MNLFDSSALICFLRGEPGADTVEDLLQSPSACSAVNWSETAQRITSRGLDWPMMRALLASYGMSVEPVTADDAEAAADSWRENRHLSLADRLCLATAERLGARVWTTDQAWGRSERVRQLR